MSDLAEDAVNMAGGWGGTPVQVETCSVASVDSVEDCVRGAAPEVIVVGSTAAADWVRSSSAADGVVTIGPVASDSNTATTGGHLPIAHSDTDLARALGAALAADPACRAGVSIMESRDPHGIELTGSVREVLTASSVPALEYRSDSQTSVACTAFLGPADELATRLDLFTQRPSAVFGLIESTFTSDMRLAIPPSATRVLVASTYLPLTESGGPPNMKELLSAGRSVDPEFVADAATVTIHSALQILGSAAGAAAEPPSGGAAIREALVAIGGADEGFGSTVDWTTLQMTSGVRTWSSPDNPS